MSVNSNIQVCGIVNSALDKYFPEESGIEIIAEPGRYFVASASTLVVNIIAKSVESFCSDSCEKCEKYKLESMPYQIFRNLFFCSTSILFLCPKI